MKRLMSISFLAAFGAAGFTAPLAGCEGEPPVMAPENALGPQPTADAGLVSMPAVQSPEAVAANSACPPPPCVPPVASPVPATSTSVSPEAPSDSEPPPPAAVKRGTISGSVTTQPAALVRNAVVYLEDHPGDTVASRMTVSIDNRQMNFIPYVQVVAAGGKVVFANTDPFPHNVFSPDNEKFNLGNIPQSGSHVRVFKTAGAYSLLCNLHPGMLGYLLVTPSPHFVRVDAKGKFSMRDVPVGTWNVSAWAPRLKAFTQSVVITEGDVTANFDLHR